MTIEIKVPPLPESVTDATLVGWHKKTGETVTRDENLVDLETDKVVLEVPAPASASADRGPSLAVRPTSIESAVSAALSSPGPLPEESAETICASGESWPGSVTSSDARSILSVAK